MKKLYNIKRTMFYSKNVDQLPGVEFKPFVYYAKDNRSYYQGLHIKCNQLVIKVKPGGRDLFTVIVSGVFNGNRDYLHRVNVSSIKEVCVVVCEYVTLKWIY